MKIVCNKETKRKVITKQLQHIMIDESIKNRDICEKLGTTKGTTANLLSPAYRPDSSMTIDQLATICDAMGYNMVIEITKKE